jgi:hypothetical protein
VAILIQERKRKKTTGTLDFYCTGPPKEVINSNTIKDIGGVYRAFCKSRRVKYYSDVFKT